MTALEATETPSRCNAMSGILFLMAFGPTTNISVLPELRGRKFWAIHFFMSLRQASMFDRFTMVSGLADMYSFVSSA